MIPVMRLRLGSWALLLALAVAPLGSLPEREKCCPMAGMGTEKMACCELDAGGACQLRRCGPGSTTFLAAVSSRADRALEVADLPVPSVAAAPVLQRTSFPAFEIPSPPVPPPRG